MNKTKITLWLIAILLVVGPIFYIGYLNREYFLATTSIGFSLEKPVQFAYRTPELANAFYWLLCLLVGLLAGNLFSLPRRIRAGRQIKKLSRELTEQEQRNRDLQMQIDSLEEIDVLEEGGDQGQNFGPVVDSIELPDEDVFDEFEDDDPLPNRNDVADEKEMR